MNREDSAGKDDAEREPTTNQRENEEEKQYQEIPVSAAWLVRDVKIPPGTVKEIPVQRTIRHEGIRLITPASIGDLHSIHPKAISLITKQPLGDSEDKPVATKQR